MNMYIWWKTKVKKEKWCVWCGRWHRNWSNDECLTCKSHISFNNALQRDGLL